MTDEIYRLRLNQKTQYNGESTDTSFYTRIDDLKAALLRAHLDIKSYGGAHNRGWRLARLWRAQDPTPDVPRTLRILGVEQHLDNEWVPLLVGFVEPEVVLYGSDDVDMTDA